MRRESGYDAFRAILVEFLERCGVGHGVAMEITAAGAVDLSRRRGRGGISVKDCDKHLPWAVHPLHMVRFSLSW